MTYTFKLARRLAQLRMASVITAALLSAACAGDDGPNGPASAGNDPESPVLTILPDSTTVGVSDTVQFTVGGLAGGSTLSLSRGGGKGKGRGNPQPTAMTVSPGTATLISSGVQRFVATETMTDGSSWQPNVKWTATGGTIDSTGKYVAASTPGEYRVVATSSDGLADTATASVVADTPVLAQLVLSPAADTVATGGRQQFTVVAKAGDGSTIAIVPTYTATGGTITAAGVYTAGQTAGAFRVIALDPTSQIADTATVTVTATPVISPATILISPATTSMQVSTTKQFSASAKLSNGASYTPSITWTETGGSISGGGMYTAGSSAGSFRVIATDTSGLADTAAVTLTAAPVLSSITVGPGTVSLAANGTQQFTATGHLSDGTTSTPSVTWTETGGSITSGGLYSAGGTPGTYTVTATSGLISGSATVTITGGATAAGCAATGILRRVDVATPAQLATALTAAQPGDCINLAAGTYSFSNSLIIAKSGTATAPLVLYGTGASTILDLNGHSLFLDGSYVQMRRLRVTDFGFEGLWLRGSHNSILDSLEVDHSAQEAIALKYSSAHNVIRDSYIHHTGTSGQPYGEGVYVGGLMPDGSIDRGSRGNRILNNRFTNIWTESVDIKGGADSTLVQGNNIDGSGTQFFNYNAVSLIAVVSSYNIIDSNYMRYGSPHAVAYFAWETMRGNTAMGNTIDLQNIHNYPGVGFSFTSGSVGGGTVKCNNVMISGGLSNVSCTP